jgi:hypothetical protein
MLLLILTSIVLYGCDSCNCGCNDDEDKETPAAEQKQTVTPPSSCSAGDTVKCPNSDKVRTCKCEADRCDFTPC